jgi:hypothetical protein
MAMYDEQPDILHRLLYQYLFDLYGKDGKVLVQKCAFGDSEASIQLFHHEQSSCKFEALLVYGKFNMPTEHFVFVTTRGGELLAFRHNDIGGVRLRIEEFLGTNVASRPVGDQIMLYAKGIFVPETAPQAVVIHL